MALIKNQRRFSMNELIFLCGLPASGKSTIAENYRQNGYVILSSDKMREKLFGSVENQDCNTELFTKLYRIAREMLSIGKSVVIDATNITSKYRRNGIESVIKNTKKDKITLNRDDIKVIADIISCTYNECINRNKARNRSVPSFVIESMYKSWQTPILQEGFDEIKLTHTIENKMDIFETIDRLINIQQYNKNHTLSIGNHCGTVAMQFDIDNEPVMYYAGLLHDIGKQFTMSFKDSNGKMSNEAHYYSHESVSAYDSLLFDGFSDDALIKISQLITWHMLPHRLETEKSIDKYKNFLGEEFWNQIIRLHEADLRGR